MKKTITSILVIVSLVSLSASAFAGKLDAKTQQALIDALNDEYKAKALYQKVLDTFGNVRPFVNIIKAEKAHIQALLPLFKRYGVKIPKDDWARKVPVFDNVQDACEAGVQAEIENVDMYDDFFSFVKEQDIRRTFTYLRNASQEKHLPAFQRCANGNGGGNGWGNGGGQGNGRNPKR